MKALGWLMAEPDSYGPDEQTYRTQALTVRERGMTDGFKTIAERYLSDPRGTDYPSPLRWLWITFTALTSRLGPRAASIIALLTVPLVVFYATAALTTSLALPIALAVTSPLLWQQGRRALQDVAVASLTMLAFGAVLRNDLVVLFAATFALLSVKEAAVLTVGALALTSQHRGLNFTPLLTMAAGAWIAAITTRMVVGSATWQVFRAALHAHDTDYTNEHQSGGLPRLVADLVLVSLLPTIAALLQANTESVAPMLFVATLLILHGLAPLQNVRTVIAADLVLRAVAGIALVPYLHHGVIGYCTIGGFFVADLVVNYKLRAVYDPVTQNLIHALRGKP